MTSIYHRMIDGLASVAVLFVATSTAVASPDTRQISFDTDEGTWVSLDVTPDGRQIVFDLLGDIYLLDIKGGEANRLGHEEWAFV